MIRQYQNGRPVRKIVPAPSATRKEYSRPFGTASEDYMKLKRELNEKEVQKLEEMWKEAGVAVQTKDMPTADQLRNKRVKVYMQDYEVETDGVLNFYLGFVHEAIEVEGGLEADIEWDGEWEDPENKRTQDQLLTREGWYNKNLGEDSWELA